MRKLGILLQFLFISGLSFSLDFDIDTLKCIDKVYEKNIKTVQFHLQDWEVSQPVAELFGDVGLTFEFDQIESKPVDYYYTIRHCTYDWQQSNLMFIDYADGFEENEINDYEDSHSTFVQYTHFTLNLPNEDLSMKISGNYLLVVYAKEPVEHIVCTRRFILYEPVVEIAGRVVKNLHGDFKTEYQKVDFTVKPKHLQVYSPREEMKIALLQNFQWNTAYFDIEPSFIDNETFTYNWEDKYIFNAGNEFRYFTFNNLEIGSEFVERIEYRKPYYYVDLVPEKAKFFQPYSSVEDINGGFVIRTNRKFDHDFPEVQSEYAIVHFSVKQPQPISGGQVYIYGQMTNYELSPQYAMKYNLETRAYECLLMLKQGFYNYQYIILPADKNSQVERQFFEGSHKETENDYQLLVYYRSPSASYDRLVGYMKFNSAD